MVTQQKTRAIAGATVGRACVKLEDILEDDELLGDVKASTATASTEEQRILQCFEEINSFIDRHKRKPGDTEHPSVAERGLKIRLAGLLNEGKSHALLQGHDRHGLLPSAVIKPLTLETILGDDDLLLTPAEAIFNLVHPRPGIAKTDKVSDRQPCQNFERFKPLFDQCARDLDDGQRKAVTFSKEQEITAGEFFILNGIMVYVAESGETHVRNGKKNARLRLIFDNGLEGNNLRRSLATELYKDPNGRRIISTDAGPLFSESPIDSDARTGMIYVVKSLSEDPHIRKLDGVLHKIGFTAGNVEDRIQKAKDDPTFLMAPVQPVATYTLYNIDKVKLEHLLHTFFADARLDIEITDRFGKKVRPREWFLVPHEVIAEAINKLQDGSIVSYRYCVDKAALVSIQN